jgi:hypothetical protein
VSISSEGEGNRVSLAATHARRAGERSIADRLMAAMPLLSVFLWLCVLYAWEAWRHGTPWLFSDELELAQLSRAIATTGHAARRGEAHSFASLYTYFIAPAWLIHNLHEAYSTVKYLGVTAMTSTIFPAYGLARFVVGRRPALFAAAASVLIPALAYSSLVVEEPLAYPYSTLCLFLIAAAFVRRTRWWIGAAVVASLIAPAVRGELVVIPAVFVLSGLLLLWRSEPVARRWARWTVWDWTGAVVLAIGAVLILNAFLAHQSYQWLIATGYYQHRMIVLGLRAAGALTIGLGVLPVVAGLASLRHAPAEMFRREVRVFRCILIAAVVAFGLYTAAKAAYVSTTFGTFTVERNLIYLAPLLFVGTALWIERRSVDPVATGIAGGFALYVALTTPYEMQFHLYSDAPGFALLQRANRSRLGLTPEQAKVLLAVVLIASLVVLLAPRVVPRAGAALAVIAAVFVLLWTGAGELAAAGASNSFSRSFLSNIHGNPAWLDKVTGGAPALYLGQQMQDQNSEWLLEFWNRSLKQVWSLDGTAQGPGPTLTPDLADVDGRLRADPGYPYVVAERGIYLVGQQIAIHDHRAGGGFSAWRLFRVAHPLRLARSIVGLYPDGWSGPNDSAYNQFSTLGGRGGTVTVRVSRREWNGPEVRSRVTILMGTLAIGSDNQPAIGRVTAARHWTVSSGRARTFVLPAPGPRFRVEVHVDRKFVPREITPQTSNDGRSLGAVVTYRVRRLAAQR